MTTLSRRVLPLLAVAALIFAAFAAGQLGRRDADGRLPWGPTERIAEADRDFEEGTQGTNDGGAGSESQELARALDEFAQARVAPGIVDPGAYSAAFAQMQALTPVGGTWYDVTKKPYDADDPNYRDYYSNSSGGSGLVTGRITALATDNSGYVYVGGADGGVWRSSTGGGAWTPIADALPSLSSGDLQIAAVDGALWYATGEANTGGTSYVGSGVYRKIGPRTGTFSTTDRVGGTELESTTINALRFDHNGRVWAATLRGVWWHADNTNTGAWIRAFAPNSTYLPGGADATNPNAAYKNIVNDIAVDPANYSHIVVAAGWRSGDAYNGFYESWNRGTSWTRINPTGGLDGTDIGNVTFAFSADGKKLYAINQSPRKLNSNATNQQTLLDGVYVSDKGLTGPWNKIASSDKLGSGGSALSKNFGVGYSPGIQSWYNQFLLVDPADSLHVFVGLEEVYETTDGGGHWNAVGPYWNFYFGCWAPDALYPPDGGPNRCPQTTHPDQHAVAIGNYGGQTWLYVGNDGGIFKRPLLGTTNRNGNATDWVSLNDGTIDALQYYAVGVGLAGSNPRRPAGTGAIVSGGLQDNGGSIFRIGGSKMSSNFGGDGGDVLVDPNDGCNIVQEYVVLAMRVTNNCASPTDPNAFLDKSVATTWSIKPPDINARFIAPFAANQTNINQWLAGGNSLWFQDNGFAIRSGAEWQKVYTWADPRRVATAIAYRGAWAIAGWCGPCNNKDFARGVVVGHYVSGSWTWTVSPMTGVPNRFVGGVAVDGSGNLYLAMNGFSRRFTEGPGAGNFHIFKSTDRGVTWVTLDGSGATGFPDVPANSIKLLSDGSLVVGTDLGVLYKASGSTVWHRLGGNFPVTVALDVEVGPDGWIYVATHGRGIWRIDDPSH